MKLFLGLTLLAVLPVVVLGHGKDFHLVKKWAFEKAFGQCIGQDNMKKLLIKKKETFRKCTGRPAPELALPIFKTPYRVASSVVDSAFDNAFSQPPQHHPRHPFPPPAFHPHRGPPPPPPPPHHRPYHGGKDDYLDQAIRRYFYKKIMKEVLDSDFNEDEDDDDSRDGMRLFQSHKGHYRYRRDDDRNEIIEKLSDKLEAESVKTSAKIGNLTCAYREFGIIDASNNLVDVEEIISHKKEQFPLEDEWLQNEFEKTVRNCYEFASALPQGILDQCEYGPEYSYLVRVKFFNMCMKLGKTKACMMKDVKDQVEANFGPIDDLSKEVGVDNVRDLLTVMQRILSDGGDEEDM